MSEIVESSNNPFRASEAPKSVATASEVQRAESEIQSALIVAKRFPRDQAAAMDRILMSCGRPGLAEDAVYQYSRGGSSISGPSIRLAEELSRQWGNMIVGVTELSRQGGQSEVLAYAWDLETNVRDEKRFVVKHWRDTRQGGYMLTDERDLYEAIANQGARRKRACILALIPGDVQDAAVFACNETLNAKADTSPAAMIQMVERFGKFGVSKEMIEAKIQRRLDAITAGQVVQLRRIYTSLKDGMATAKDFFETASTASPESQQPATARKTGNAGLKEALKPAAPPGSSPGSSQQPEPSEAADLPFSYEEIDQLLREATTMEALDMAMDVARQLTQAEQDALLKVKIARGLKLFAGTSQKPEA